MRVKAIYRKNLFNKLFKKNDKYVVASKIAAQVSHAVTGAGVTDPRCTLVVLPVSDKKFEELVERHSAYVHADSGLTLIEGGTRSAAAWVEEV